LDEPTTGLDVSVQALVLDTLKQLQQELTVTILIVSA
jgi:putative phosphonate transport system ATP-binding protein